MKVFILTVVIAIGGLTLLGDNLSGMFEGAPAVAVAKVETPAPVKVAKVETPAPVKVAKAKPVEVAKAEPLRWYEGGTLHTSPAKQWLTAPYRDKMATAADWVVTIRGEDHYDWQVANAIPDAKAMVTCLNEALAGPVVPKDKLSTLAAICGRLMGW